MAEGIYIFLAAVCFIDLLLVFKRDLMMLQQNSYRNERYVRWFNTSSESTNLWRLASCIALFLLLVNNIPHLLAAIVASLILVANIIAYATKRYKKPLVFTPRARRIYGVMLVLGLAAPVAIGICCRSIYLADELGILALFISPLFLLLANFLLKPVEKVINNKYYSEAADILKSNKDLKVIGITGSYGKTSTKHFLYHLLKQKYETVMTPGSFNTLLGVIRTTRETLKPYTQIFIAEMGAKQPGDIREICDLVHPSIGIITSIGEQHLETFKSVENVLKTKFELVDSLPADGLAVVNDTNPIVDTLKIDGKEVIYYGKEEDVYRISDLRYTGNGTTFTFEGPDGLRQELKTPLIGEANITNLLGSIIVAKKLNLSDAEIKYAVATVPQVEHRLQVSHTPNGFTIIDDAFNSNPSGASMALDVLKSMVTDGKRIIITPGMIELGDMQVEKNREFGRKIGETADIAIIVGHYNRDAILEGLAQTDIDRNSVFAVETFAEGQKLMLTKVGKGDVVLYENDLPDTFK